MWVSYGYDGAIAGTFLEFHHSRPLPSHLGVQEVTTFDGMSLEQGYDGVLADGVISVKRLNYLLAEIDKKENGTPSEEWSQFESKLSDFNKKMMFNNVLNRKFKAMEINCGSCGSIPHVQGCPKGCIECATEDPIRHHVSGLCKSCYDVYKQTLRDGLSVGEQ
jgi:hypothetical protein